MRVICGNRLDPYLFGDLDKTDFINRFFLNAVILQGVTLGRGCIVGAGAVVTRSIPPWSIAMGVPARVVGRRPGAPESAAEAR